MLIGPWVGRDKSPSHCLKSIKEFLTPGCRRHPEVSARSPGFRPSLKVKLHQGPVLSCLGTCQPPAAINMTSIASRLSALRGPCKPTLSCPQSPLPPSLSSLVYIISDGAEEVEFQRHLEHAHTQPGRDSSWAWLQRCFTSKWELGAGSGQGAGAGTFEPVEAGGFPGPQERRDA